MSCRQCCRHFIAIIASGIAVLALTLPADALGDPDIFPEAKFDAVETAALAVAGENGPRVFRTDRPFEVVLNYYRFKRKQSVQITEEPIGAAFTQIANAFDRGASPALRSWRLVEQFHRHIFGVAAVDDAKAAGAWRAHAWHLGTRTQRIAEGERVTLYRPYLSRKTFTVIDETVIVLQTLGGSQ